LLEPSWERTKDALPEYNNHGDVLNEYWPRLTDELPDFQYTLVDDDDEIVARGRSIPVRWDGTVADLPAGIDEAIVRGFEEGQANVLCALVVVVPRDRQSAGLSAVALQAMAAIARRHGFGSLIAPVRPSLKERYPSFQSSATSRGGVRTACSSIRGCASTNASEPPCSVRTKSPRITGTVEDWQAWTEMRFPEDPAYWFPHGLATVGIDHAADQGRYWEPNVWMHHAL
jgi:hypothetical protein